MGVEIGWGLKEGLGPLNVGEIAFCTDTNELYIGTVLGNAKLAHKESINEAYGIDENGEAIVDHRFLIRAGKKLIKGNLAPYIAL